MQNSCKAYHRENKIEVATKSQAATAQNEKKIRIWKYGLTGRGLEQ